jgi:DNA-binding transcriptional regulator PaaX
MGELEKVVRKKIRNTQIQRIVLKTLAATGLISVALLAPNALQMIEKLGFLKDDKGSNQRKSINLSRKRLIERGYIKYDGKYLSLTTDGERVLRDLEAYDYRIEKPKRWDGKWRMVIFDIKEERRLYRDDLRRILSNIGFLKLQNSVWVYPYDCEDLVNLIKTDFKMGKEVLYIIADQIENDRMIRQYFKLI